MWSYENGSAAHIDSKVNSLITQHLGVIKSNSSKHDSSVDVTSLWLTALQCGGVLLQTLNDMDGLVSDLISRMSNAEMSCDAFYSFKEQVELIQNE